jgi:hypothetical protein
VRRLLLPALLLTAGLHAEEDIWDQPPLRYSSTTPANELSVFSGTVAPQIPADRPPLERLRMLLDYLHVAVQSQILVFSKTSMQNGLIQPKNPRCLFFSENCYVGYVPGGAMEVIVEDPVLGPVFYRIEGEWKISRDQTDCLACHATARTEGMPGMLVRSTFPQADGLPMLHLGSQTVTHVTPLAKRWGGYYVTGRSSLPHLGNQTFTAGVEPETSSAVTTDVSENVDTSKYLLPTSDIVALLTLEHQCQMHNLLHAARAQYQRTCFLSKLAAPDSDPDKGAGGRLADQMAERIVDGLLFKDETDLQGEVEGNGAFEAAFTPRYPHTADGHSLAEFQMNSRIFKNRCSYMIYSRAFSSLPPRVKTAVMKKLKAVLSAEKAEDDYAAIKVPERRRIAAILEETLAGWREGG